MRKLNNHGFTIIELLIAMVSFSLILLIITGAIIQFSSVYYKGVVTSKTQETARAVADNIARSAQFSSELPTEVFPSPTVHNNYGMVCIGSKRYNYTLNKLLVDEVNHVLTADAQAGCTPYDGHTGTPANATELLGEKMQLLRLRVEQAGDGIITVKVTVAYGNDVVINPTDRSKSTCPGISLGGQFCAISNVETTVTKRL